ncbi:MAG TPA: hypothetical protein VJZ26_07880 [Blastocatellia bacterium]|nr:hypothetical protein [Blastocatellia bacterium]
MASETLNQRLRPRMFTLRVLWFAMTTTILFFVLVAYLMAAQNETSPASVGTGLRTTFYAIAVGCAVASFLLRRAFFSKFRSANAQTGQVDEAKVMKMTVRYFTSMLLSLALHEVITICGMMLCVLEQKFEPILPFAAFSILLNLLVFPRLNMFIDRSAPMKARF